MCFKFTWYVRCHFCKQLMTNVYMNFILKRQPSDINVSQYALHFKLR